MTVDPEQLSHVLDEKHPKETWPYPFGHPEPCRFCRKSFYKNCIRGNNYMDNGDQVKLSEERDNVGKIKYK